MSTVPFLFRPLHGEVGSLFPLDYFFKRAKPYSIIVHKVKSLTFIFFQMNSVIFSKADLEHNGLLKRFLGNICEH